jgi:serine/threonine protein kinase
MKYCPACKTNYPDSERYCPTEGRLLSLPDPYHLVGRTLLEKYRMEALVGLGGMGAVYSAHHLTIHRHVAIKILQPNLALGNARLLGLFQREAEMAGQLNHENIVDIKDAGLTPDPLAYIVMEWLEGVTLETELETKGRIELGRAAAILRQVAAALDHAHARHIIHRDLKPANIMLVRGLDGREQVKVVDFGIAKAVREFGAPGADSVSLLLGTPHYASPEQFVAGSRLDGRSDIYSLGVTLYRMLCGALPFSAQTLQELIRLQRTTLPPPIRRYRPEAPAQIEQLLLQMLDRAPANRPARALDVFHQFARALNEGAGGTDRLVNDDTPTASSPAGDPETPEYSALTIERMAVLDTIEERGATTDENSHILPAGAGGSFESSLLEPPGTGESPRREPADRSSPTYRMRTTALILVALLLGLAALYVAGIRSRPSDEVLLSYYLEIGGDDCRPLTRGTGDEPLDPAQFFKFQFIPRRSGYLYILAPNEKNVPTTFLTAHPDSETGVQTNFVEAGRTYSFPSGEGRCIGIQGDERMMAFTLIFSPALLANPGFLAAPALHELSATEQHQFHNWRSQQPSAAPQLHPDAAQQVTHVYLKMDSDRLVIFDLLVKRR